MEILKGKEGYGNRVKEVVVIGLMSTLVFLGTYITKIEITILGGVTMIHLGNMFCLISALLYGKKVGGLSGAIGMSMVDIISGNFVVYFPFIFVLKFVMGYVCGMIKSAHQGLSQTKTNFMAIIISLLINVVFSPINSFLIRVIFYKIDGYIALINTIGSVISVIINSIISGVLALIIIRFIEPSFKRYQ